ncbi:MAG: O-antigen ligase family protein [Acidimicrobiales bacterium]
MAARPLLRTVEPPASGGVIDGADHPGDRGSEPDLIDAGLRSEVRQRLDWPSVVVVALLALSAGAVPLLVVIDRPDHYVLPKLLALWAVLTVSAVFLACCRREGVGPLGRTPAGLSIPIGLFGLLVVIATVRSDRPRMSLLGEPSQHQGLLSVLLYLGFFIVAALVVTNTRRLRWIHRLVAAGGTAVAACAIAQRQGWDPWWGSILPVDRVMATIGQPNALATYLVLTMSVTVGLLAWDRRGRRAIVAAALVAQMVALAMTASRGGYLGALTAAVIGLGLWWSGRERFHRSGVLRPAVVVAVVLVAGVLWAPTRGVFTDSARRLATSTNVAADESVRNHLDQWRVAAHLVREHPLSGVGPERFPDAWVIHRDHVLAPDRVAYFDQYRVESPHNLALEVAAGSGLPAALCLFWAFGAIAIRLRRAARPETLSILVGMAGFLVASSFMTAEVTSSWLMWTLMGAGVGVGVGVRATGSAAGRAARLK